VSSGSSPRSPFGGPLQPQRALEDAAARLAEWYRVSAFENGRVVLASDDTALPDAALSLEKDRRLFSRTFQLVVTAFAPGDGPAADAALALRARRVLRRDQLEWSGAEPPDGNRWVAAFVDAGLLSGAATMTNVRELRLSHERGQGRWSLRLVTLAGALIGTSPGSAIVVPLEPEDVDGLMQILRALPAGARGTA